MYHHASIGPAWWVALRLHPGGDVYFGAFMNSFIHVILYSYYLLALLKIPCFWKKYLTVAQLTQFCLVILHSATYVMFYMDIESACWKETFFCHLLQDWEMSSLFVLFLFFYRRAYSKQRVRASLTENTKTDSSVGTAEESLETAEESLIETTEESSLDEEES